MNTLPLLQGLRFIDNFFPSGGFAFSSGLEAAVQGGIVRDAAGYQSFITDLLRTGIGTREAVAVGLTWDAAHAGSFGQVVMLDQQLEAMQFSGESRKASRQMGRQVVRVAAEQLSGGLLEDLQSAVEAGRVPGHLPVVMGVTLHTAGWGKQESVAGFLYQTIVGYNAAALKLLPIGQRESQRFLHEWLPLLAEVSARASTAVALMSWAPIHDICAMRHSRLESRLFRS